MFDLAVRAEHTISTHAQSTQSSSTMPIDVHQRLVETCREGHIDDHALCWYGLRVAHSRAF